MKRIKRVIGETVLVLSAGFLLIPTQAGAEELQTAEAEMNVSEDGEIYLSSPYDQSFFNYSTVSQKNGRSALPDRYDLREQGNVTKVVNQAGLGCCWAITAASAAESNVQMQHPELAGINFSERHLTWFAYQLADDGNGGMEGIQNKTSVPWNQGGYREMTVGQLASWSGLVSEDQAPFTLNTNEWPLEDSTHWDSQVRLQNAEFLPVPAVFSGGGSYQFDGDAVKAMKETLMENGALDISIYMDPSARINQYLNRKVGANHEVTVTGWDDTYSKEAFTGGVKPPADGAWIVKNSWGDDWGDQGYFYLSYYDQTIDGATSYQMELQDEQGKFTYDHNYQYDYLGLKSHTVINPVKTQSRVANIFEAKGNEVLKAVSAYCLSPGSQIDIKVYKGKDRTNPEDGELVYSDSVTMEFGGFYTIPLKKGIFLKKGELFSVVEQIKGNGSYVIPVELAGTAPYGGVDKNNQSVSDANQAYITIQRGESFLNQGRGWKDMADQPLGLDKITLKQGNLVIKAYTCDDFTAPAAPSRPSIIRRTDTILEIQTTPGELYSIDQGENWQSSGIFTGLYPGREYILTAKTAETDECMESDPSEALYVRTKEAAPVLASPKLKAKSERTITVEKVEGVRYSIDGGKNWQETGSFEGLNPNQSYRIFGMASETEERMGSAVSPSLTVITDKSQPVRPQPKKSLQITFQANGGSISVKKKSVATGRNYGSLPSGKRKGYLFDGWYTTRTGKKKILSKTRVTASGNQILYAHWTKLKTAKPAGVSLKSTRPGKLTITIKPVKGASGYQILYASNKAMTKGKKCLTVTAAKKSISGLKKGKNCYVKVRAYRNDSAGNKVYGAYTSVKKGIIRK